MGKVQGIFILLLFATILSSCSVLRPSEMFKTEKGYPVSEFESSKLEYVIQPHDKLGVRVLSNTGESFFGTGNSEQSNRNRQNNNQTGDLFSVEYDGKIKLPILGRIEISGKTIREAETYLEEMYSQYFVQPFVLLTVTNRKVTLFMNGGTKANTITMTGDRLTLIEAIAQCGGLTETSKAYKIKLIRGNITDKPKIYYWNISSIEELEQSNVLLETNDIIYIESRPQYFSRVLREISPYLTLVTTLFSVYGIFYTAFTNSK